MPTKIYTSKQLTNERYHSPEFPQASGSVLACIYDSTPAEFFYGERKETKALIEGAGLHVCVLEPVAFKERYARGIDPADHKEALVTNKDLESFLRDTGRKGYSGKTKAELIAMIHDAGERPEILDIIIKEHAALNIDKIILSYEAYDMVVAMRSALKKFGGYILTREMQSEVSIISESMKCRIDNLVPAGEMAPDGVITKNGEIWDLKSARTVKPDLFGLQAERLLYWLKMAVQHDLFLEHFGVAPDRVVLLAQSKTLPYLPQAYVLTKAQLEVGRQLYLGTLSVFLECKNSGNWPGYGGGVMELPTSGRARFEFGIEDDVEIEFSGGD